MVSSPHRRASLCRLLASTPPRLCTGDQVHGIEIAAVSADATVAAGSGDVSPPVYEATDGFVTATPGVTLLAQTADCPLVLLFAANGPALALGHSGWRGTFARMPARLVARLAAEFDVPASELIAVVSPSAGACCYEIKDDVYRELAAVRRDPDRFVRRTDRAMFLNLGELIATQLVESGVPAGAVHLPSQCSICDERFFSYRRQGPGAGHAGLAACLS